MIPTQQPTPFQSASLYVGDLLAEITEGELFELFNRVGPVASIRVCRDSVTRRSLGYSYVNFHNVQDAERALDTMNFTEIKSRPCRIMWSQRDPSLRKSGVGNIFVKNLAPVVDNKALFDTFSVFGNILSCKVATDETGASKGYGYVHYETAESAQEAIQKVNGNSIEDCVVLVGPFVRREGRPVDKEWTTLYAKHFLPSWDEPKLDAVFNVYGPLKSVFIARDAEGKSKAFAFINFQDHAAAEKALAELQGKTMPEEGEEPAFELYVNRAQKKGERTREIKARVDALNQEKLAKFQGMNLYVKNLDDSVNDDVLRAQFAQFGTITSARVMRDTDNVTSRGFGFVCFSSAEEATRAITEMNGKTIGGKPIVVTLHQRKELRQAHLAATYANRNMRNFPPQQANMPMGYMNMYMPQGQQGFPRGAFPQQGFPVPPFAGQRQASPRGMPFPGRGAPQNFYPMPAFNNMPPQQMMQQGQMQGQQGQFRRGPMPGQQQGMPQGGMNQQMGGGRMRGPVGGRGGPGGRGPMGAPQGMMMPQQQQQGRAPGGMKFTTQVRNAQGGMMMGPGGMGQQMMPAQQPMAQMGFDPLDDQTLAQADPQQQKNMIGERLYPLIQEHNPELAGKITGMLLEMDNAELLNLLESPDALTSKVEEAMNVLSMYKSEQ